jgi:hypothetical protein
MSHDRYRPLQTVYASQCSSAPPASTDRATQLRAGRYWPQLKPALNRNYDAEESENHLTFLTYSTAAFLISTIPVPSVACELPPTLGAAVVSLARSLALGLGSSKFVLISAEGQSPEVGSISTVQTIK